MTGTQFVDFISGMNESQREHVIHEQLIQGNFPEFLRKLKPVPIPDRTDKNKTHAIIFVMPDYLAIGSDDDFIRIPMNYYTAAAVASRFGFILPTKKMVDAIYHYCGHHLRPLPMQPGPQMRSTAYYLCHNNRIKHQRTSLGIPLNALLAGHKKDLVLTNRLNRRKRRIAIYGWHRLSGVPIQPLSTVHGALYADYSHGVRLVSNRVIIDGKECSIYDILCNPDQAGFLCDEGPILNVRQLLQQAHPAPPHTYHAAGESPQKPDRP